MQRHTLKTLPAYFVAQADGLKKFEIRRHDRDFRLGDEVLLTEIDGKLGQEYTPTGRTHLVRITYILRSDPQSPFEGLDIGYSILGTEAI